MAKFLTGNTLNLELERIFERAEEKLILISPYIKLHSRYTSVLKTKIENDKLEIIVVFGKNEDNKSRSMKEEDFEFFKSFPNIRIFYEPTLHAKYYANDDSAILTSMNLYSFSQDTNIEAGILMKIDSIGDLANSLVTNLSGDQSMDRQAAEYFDRVIEQAEICFDREPQYESTLMGLHKKYKSSINKVDKLTELFAAKNIHGVKSGSKTSNVEEKTRDGFCIRTGVEIPFNTSHPFTKESFESWNRYKNGDFAEKYCHFSGEPSNGLTSFSKPILKKNWANAKEIHNL
jgi:hypothetical protein